MPDNLEKKKHIYMFSEHANYGKTYFLNQLEVMYRCSRYMSSETYAQSLLPDTELLLMDCFKRIDWFVLEQMCDGHYEYPKKNGDPVRLNNATIVICGNVHPLELYGPFQRGNHFTQSRMELFEARFRVVNLETDLVDGAYINM